jgi:hypothetical protein
MVMDGDVGMVQNLPGNLVLDKYMWSQGLNV